MRMPDHIGRYIVRAEIERGGMSTVYLAHDPRFDRDVAIKILPREMLHDQTFRARFDREAHVIASLEHPAIVPVYDFGEENEQPYLVMRYMTGGSLEDKLKKGPLSLAEAARIISGIAQGLDEAHERGIVHRDLKPGNILFDHRNAPYISDFGIAKLTVSTKSLTAASIIGTPAYMSPEQARGEHDIDSRSDIYALGAILFEMLCGQVPFDAETPTGQMLRHITDPVPDILALNPSLPRACQKVIARAMAKHAFARYSSTTEMAEALGKIARGEPASTYKRTISLPSPSVAKPRTPKPRTPKPSSSHRFPSPLITRWRTLPRWIIWAGVGVLGLVSIVFVSKYIISPMLLSKSTSGNTAITPTVAKLLAVSTATFTSTPPKKFSPTATEFLPATYTPTPIPSLTPKLSIQFIALEMAGVVEYTVDSMGTFQPLGLKVPVACQPGLTIRTASNGKAKIRLSDGSFLYLIQGTNMIVESIIDTAAGGDTVLTLNQGGLLVESGSLTVNTLAGQAAEIDGGLMGVRYSISGGPFRVDCLEGSCRVNVPDRAPIVLSTGKSIGSTSWEIGPAECVFWEALSSGLIKCEKTPTPEFTLTPSATSTDTPTNTVYIKPPSSPTRTKKSKTNTPNPLVPP